MKDCFGKGGVMEGKCDEVLACKCAACEAKGSATANKGTNPKPTAATGKPGGLHYDTNGHMYLLDGKTHQAIYVASAPEPTESPAPSTSTEFAGLASSSVTPVFICEVSDAEEDEYTTLITADNPLTTSLDWCSHTCPVDFTGITYKAPNQHQRTIVDPSIVPLFLDSGASVHISNNKADFFTLCPIPPCSVKGVGGSSMQAIGVGTASGHC
jgi:hypothetical protein